MPYNRPLDEPEALVGKACLQLRSKGMYVTGQLDPADAGHSDGHCWCNLTQKPLGPDNVLVERTTCRTGRGCFQEVL